MSSGLGRVECMALDFLTEDSRGTRSTFEVANHIFLLSQNPQKIRHVAAFPREDRAKLAPGVNSTHRALVSLHAKGLIFRTSRRRFGQVHWGDMPAIVGYMISCLADGISDDSELNPLLFADKADPKVHQYLGVLNRARLDTSKSHK